MIDIILISSLAGIIGTGLGGLFGIFFGSKTIGKTLSFTGGIMMGIVFFDLIPISISNSNLFIAVISVLIGVFLVCFLDSFILSIRKNNDTSQDRNLINVGIILLISMSLHNFPEGLAIGSSSAVNIKTGIIVAIIIAIHDIPEGMAIATPLTGGKMNKYKILILTVLSGLSTIAGAIIGKLLGNLSNTSSSICLGIAGGAMLYVVYGELIPSALENSGKKQNALITIFGIIISLIILNFVN